MHQLWQRRTNQPGEHRGITPTIHRIPRYPQQISLQLPSQDLQRGHLSLSTIYSGAYDSSSAEVSNCAYSSAKANQFYEDNQCRHQSSAPYQQWQNAVERDIQTILSNVSATLRGQDFMRADIWAHALTHWTRLHNAFSPCRPTGHTSAYP